MQSNKSLYIVLLCLTLMSGVLSSVPILRAQSPFPLRNKQVFLQLADSIARKSKNILPNNINIISLQNNSPCEEEIRNALWRLSSDIVVNDSANHKMESISCTIQYLPFATENGDVTYDVFVRECKISLYLVTTSNGNTSGQPVEALFRDTVRKVDIPLLEEFAPEYAKSGIPTPPSTFWDDILSPIVFIAATAVTTVLLFTSRSR